MLPWTHVPISLALGDRMIERMIRRARNGALWCVALAIGYGLVAGGIDGLQAPVAANGQQQAAMGAPPPAPAPAPPAYPGDDAPRNQRAAWMAWHAQQRGLPAELPVMAALVESGRLMQNLDHGDRDSVGLFQMRTRIHNKGEYAGYPSRPELQIKWFLDTAERVKADRIAKGLPLTPDHFGVWIADVERCADEYRYRYQLRLDEARALLAGGQ